MPYEMSITLLIKIMGSALLLMIIISSGVFANPAISNELSKDKFISSIGPIPKKIQHRMQLSSWHQGCPVALNELAYVKLTYFGFDNQTHTGALIVNKGLAKEIVDIFKALYLHKFPIQRIALMEEFQNDDQAAMAANNTSSFNCRAVTGLPGLFSQHSYGRAIDINPLINPYVTENNVLPLTGTPFVDRNKPHPGKITQQSIIYNEFMKHGWDWGGHWYDVQDYQHFEKRAHGERRNPYGYQTR